MRQVISLSRVHHYPSRILVCGDVWCFVCFVVPPVGSMETAIGAFEWLITNTRRDARE